MHKTMDSLFTPKLMEFKRALDQAHSDHLSFPLELDIPLDTEPEA